MSGTQFAKTKDFIELMVNKSDIGPDKVQIGLLQFSSVPKEEFPLNRHYNKPDIRKALSAMSQIKSGTMTGEALHFASAYFDESTGGRRGVKQYLIVVTDGESNDKVEEPARAIRDKGVIIYAIGILKANSSQLFEITGTQEKVFIEDNFDALLLLDKQIFFEMCNPEDGKYHEMWIL